MPQKARTFDALEKRLGYEFADKELLRRALTHSSAISPAKRVHSSYQRLEFLGDRVLGLVVADLMYRRRPEANEGELSRTLNSVVRKESCAEVARNLRLGEDVVLGDSEARTGGADKDAILADVCEAIIGAIYSDGGLQKAYKFVERSFAAHLSNQDARKADAKTALQEWAQGRGLPLPSYTEVSREGPPHDPLFTISVEVAGQPPQSGTGRSKRMAEQDAAAQLLALVKGTAR